MRILGEDDAETRRLCEEQADALGSWLDRWGSYECGRIIAAHIIRDSHAPTPRGMDAILEVRAREALLDE